MSFLRAVEQGIITSEQAKLLEAMYGSASGRRFDVVNLFWYLGALIIMGSMGLFATTAFSMMGGHALLVISVSYAAAFTWAGHYFWHHRNMQTLGGLFIAIAVSMVPLFVFSTQEVMGWWGAKGQAGPYKDYFLIIKSGWIPMGLATVGAAYLATRYFRFAFIAFIASVALWFLSMDIALLIYNQESITFEQRRIVSLYFGFSMIFIAWFIDVKNKETDYAFWLHICAATCFWAGLSLSNSNSEILKLIYCLINIFMLVFAVFIRRFVYAIYGGLGLCLYLGDLSQRVFKDSLFFPFSLSLMGLGVIWLGFFLYKRQAFFSEKLGHFIPTSLQSWRPQRA